MQNAILRFLVSFTFIAVTHATYSQAPDHKPYMWVQKDTGQMQINLFNSLKLPKIAANLPTVQTNRFFLGNFFGMFQYLSDTYGKNFVELSVYIGVCNGDGVPAGYDNKIILIFQPVVRGQDVGYYILPKAFDASTVAEFKRPKNVIDTWTAKYRSIMPTSTVPIDVDNIYEDPATHKKRKSETRYVTYCVEDFKKFYAFQKFYGDSYNISTNLVGYLASYLSVGNRKKRFKKRLITEFNFLDKSGQDFYLESIDGFLRLPEEDSVCFPSAKFAGDNGQLCPTYCPR